MKFLNDENRLGEPASAVVIDVELIKSIITESQSESDEKPEKSVQGCFSSIKGLRLEFRDIICIDSLWMLTNLTELYLNNNRIRKIENIETLTNLTKLDLSFNQITKIENLETLGKLTKLSLSYNQISKLENLDNCLLLKVLICGFNFFKDLNDVLYLRKLQNLRTLTLIGNPFTVIDGFIDYVATNLPQLVYLDFKMLRYGDGKDTRLLHVQRETAAQNSRSKNVIRFEGKIYADEFEFHADAFVENLDDYQLFESFFPDDDVKEISGESPETEDHLQRFRSNVYNCTQFIFNLGLKRLALRNQEFSDYDESMRKIERDFSSDSNKFIDQFGEEKSSIFVDLRKCMSKMSKHKNDEVIAELKCIQEVFETKLQSVWFELMQLEDIRGIQIKGLLGILQKNLKLIVKDFTHQAKGFFSQIREHVNFFMMMLKDHVQNESHTNASEDDSQASDEFEKALEKINTGKEIMYNIIDVREDSLIISAWSWYDELIQQLEQEEFARSRNMVLQINNFSDFQIVELTAELSNTTPKEQTEFSYSEVQMIKDLSQIM